MFDAIDVSKHQGKFDWRAAYCKGIRHAMLRAGYGRHASQKDPQFERNAAECARLGIQYGMDVTNIQKMLGHANIATTMIYADVQSDDVRSQHKKYIV